MTRRKALAAAERAAVPEDKVQLMAQFTPVPRKYRYDGWTPERQRAFIAALAETGSVTRAAARVNMAQANCYTLRRAPGAEGFRRAWDAALDFGVKKLKDIAFERAIEGYLVPVFVAGKLMGFRRKYNDALLMFCLRHYGENADGKRTTINYFSTRASAGAASAQAPTRSADAGAGSEPPPPACGRSPSPSRGGAAVAEASTTTVRTVIGGAGGANDNAGRLDAAAGVLDGFEGVTLDAEAQAAIAAAIEGYAARVRAAEAALEEGGEAAADAGEALGHGFIRTGPKADPYRGTFEPGVQIEEVLPFVPGEPHWSLAGADKPAALIAFEEEVAARAAGAPPAAAEGAGEGGGEP
jgi:hypothetical protein